MEKPSDEEKNAAEVVEHEHIVSQKDIHDFWEHVSNEDRVDDVCTTFVSESKLVTSRLYASTASFAEKFAVANFLLQVGALQFRVQKSATNEDELQTVIILQKPDNTQNHEGESAPQVQATKEGDKASVEKGPAQEENKTPPPPPSPPHEPPAPEEHECSKCHRVLTSLWELDLHMLDECKPEKVTVGKLEVDAETTKTIDESAETKSTGVGEETATEGGETVIEVPADETKSLSQEIAAETEISSTEDVKVVETSPTEDVTGTETSPTKDVTGTEISHTADPEAQSGTAQITPQHLQGSSQLGEEENQGTKRKRGRPRKYKPIPSESPVQEKEKRKRGRPRKDTSNSPDADMKDGKDKNQNVGKNKSRVKLPTLTGTRSKRKRWLPVKYRETYEEGKLDKDGANDDQLNGKDASEGLEDGSTQNVTEGDYDLVMEEILMESDESDEDESILEESDEDSDATGTGELTKGAAAKKTECDICHKTFCQSNYLAKHKLIMHSGRKETFKCSTCKKLFTLKSMFKRHLVMHQNKARNIRFTCSFCNTFFYDKYTLNNHEKIHNKKDIKCDFCDKTFVHESMMRRHRNNMHTKEVNYPCTLCDKVFYLKNRLKDHMVTHSGKKEHKCEECGMEFFHLNRLKLHRKTVHIKGKPFLCALCGSEFKSKATLKQHHLTTHTDIKNYPCRHCGKQFARTSLRNQHERVHEGLNPHPCEYCGKGFRDKFKLKVHLNWHRGIRPFSCDICKKNFLVKGNLTKHMRLHTGERPYVCEECGHGCVDSSQLKKHMARNHNIHIGRRLTKGPGRADGELPSRPAKRKRQEDSAKNVTAQVDSNTQETQAYTIATDALIEFSQQLADMSNAIPVRGQIVVSNEMVAATNVPQEGASEVVSTTGTHPIEPGQPGQDLFPVMIQVATQDNQVTVPVTQSIGDFQSLELMTLSS